MTDQMNRPSMQTGDQSTADSAQSRRDADPLNLSPHSVEAEEAVLGSILMNPEALYEVRTFLTADDFFILRHGWIFEALIRLAERDDAIDTRTLAEELRALGQLEDVGGEAYLNYLPNTMPTALHAEVYGHIVERAALRRRLLGAAGDIAQLAHDEERDINEVIDQAESTLFTVTEQRLRQELVPMPIALTHYYNQIETLRQKDVESLGVPTGFHDLDDLLGGLQKSDLLIIAGRPGMGKTSFMLSLVLNAARQGQARIAVFSMEMSNDQLVQRLISSATGISAQNLRLGQVNDDEWSRFVEATGSMSNLKIYFDDSPAISAMQLRTKCRRLYREHGLDLIVVDYLQLMNAGGAVGAQSNRVQEITYISRALKELARELNVPLLSAAQLSRAVEQRQDKRPQLSDLRESGCLTGDTPVILADTGQVVPIADLEGQNGFNIWALNEQTMQLEPAAVSHAFCTGTKPVYRMTTRLGRTIRATSNHKFRTIHGWQRLDALAVEDQIAIPLACVYSEPVGAALSAALGEFQTRPYTPRFNDALQEDSITWDTIVGIEPDGEAPVYDLTVPGHHNFVAGDIIVHNSIEQDADCVMFLYRDEVYNEATEHPGEAEIIIAKHRNGPTGVVTLLFRKEITQFVNMRKQRVDLKNI